jgi:hypothetical protein
MVTTTSRQKPKYFFVVFGEKHASKHPVDGGVYPHRKGHIANSGMRAGDVVLLHCAESYLKHSKEAPGIGIVTAVETGGEKEKFDYHYLPLDGAVPFNVIKKAIPELRYPLHFIGNWLQGISNTSFQRALAGRQVIWP